MNRFLYSLAYIVLLGIPAGILFYFNQDVLNLKALAVTTLICLFVGGIFDIWAVKQGRRDKFFIWEYNSKSILGFKILGLPVEDIFLFLVLTPVFLIAVYEAIRKMAETNDLLLTRVLGVGMVLLILAYLGVYKHAIKSKKR